MFELPESDFRVAVDRLRDLIRFDTTNPPGNEREAAEFLAGILREAGFSPELVGRHESRPNLVARLDAKPENRRNRPLILSCHLDVVPADRERWTHPPFDAVEADGCVWGRGAIDMKGFAVMALTVFLLLKEKKIELDRDVIFVAVADEEAGTNLGSRWLVENRPDLLGGDPEYVINEVGGFTLHQHGKRFYPVQVAEKGIAWLRMTATGRPGHSSLPQPENAIAKLGEAAAKLNRASLPWHVSEPARYFLTEMARGRGPVAAWVCRNLLLNRRLGPLLLPLLVPRERRATFEALVRNTATPTIFASGTKINMSPPNATLELDGRLVPGQTADDLVREIRAVAGSGFEIEILSDFPATVFDSDTPLFQKIEAGLNARDPDGSVIPSMIPGFTDSSNYARLGATCYGFYPLKLPPDLDFAALFHGDDERIPLDGLKWGIETLYDVLVGALEAK
ncbi:MAG: M20/M25/M40 family metallo-hydrolase [Verrucomicrobiales bacterium]|nr:M20/M25/M40 family metallo-hydrolase [Verrucomicrobiales bacterium]